MSSLAVDARHGDDPLALETLHAFDVQLFFEKRWDCGPGPGGAHQHYTSVGTGSTVSGPLLNGTVVDHSGADWPTKRADGVVELNAHYVLLTDDGVRIYLHNLGYVHGPIEAEGAAIPAYFRCTPYFRAPAGRYDWLNRKVLVGVGQRRPKIAPDDPPDHSLFRYHLVL